jgi:DNA sulfur modification protein DndE
MRDAFVIKLLTAFIVCCSFTVCEETPRIFLIGDSTMANKTEAVAPETGWGMIFPEYIGLPVENHAVNGRSTKSFRTLGHWRTVYEKLRPGDWVFIQFGHNDSKESDTSRYAPAQTDYRKNLERYIAEIRSKGAQPLLITPVMRRKFDDKGIFVDQHGDYPTVVKEVGKAQRVPVLDLHAKSRAVIVQHGVEGSRQIFLNVPPGVWKHYPEGKEDNTHFTRYGAACMASLVAAGLRELDLDLAKALKQLPVGNKYVYELPKVMEVAFRKDTFNIEKYGARGDGLTSNTEAIRRAVDACSAAGGGTVLIPRGLWLTGPVVMKSHVNLHIVAGAVLQFTDRTEEYPLVRTNWEGLDAIRAQSPLSAADAENIAITGGGVIDGAGDAWRPVKKGKLTPPEWEHLVKSGGVLSEAGDTWYPTARALKGSLAKRAGVIAEGYDIQKAEEIREFLRPNLLSIARCKRVLLEGVTFQNSPAWGLHPLLTQHLTLRGLTVRNPWNAQNGDGVDIESCRNVLVDRCSFDVGDDGICIKSGRDAEGRKRGVPTEDVIVQHCTVFHGHGGFVIGSEMSGGARNIFVSDCNFLGTDVGLRFKTTRGRGGIVEKIYVDNIRMSGIGGAAILFDMYYMAKDPLAMFAGDEKPSVAFEPVTDATPQFRDFHIRNVVCKGAETAIFVRGLPEMNIQTISLSDISIQSKIGFVCTEGNHITLRNATLQCASESVVDVHDSQDLVLENVQSGNNDVFVQVSGSRSKDIQLVGANGTGTKKDIALTNGVSAKAVRRK